MNDLTLAGCLPAVLGGYLKAIAVHRIVASQLDEQARAYWDENDQFHLLTRVTEDELIHFFADDYRPAPIIAPWNGGSGFWPKDQQAGIEAIEASTSKRFEEYRRAIQTAREAIKSLNLTEKPEKEQKTELLRRLRAKLSDAAVAWLDAVYVVSDDPRYPAILGTGGNDGRLEFGNNFMQRIAELFLAEGSPAKKRRDGFDIKAALSAAILGTRQSSVYRKAAVGQFVPSLAGGPNMTFGVDGDARVNPWDFVFALEGALNFAGAAVRRLDDDSFGSAAFPFHVSVAHVGFASASEGDNDKARAEIWLPLWSRPANHAELTALFAEGRLQVGRRRARTGFDAHLALASLGVDRGFERFVRIAILQRNGLSYLAAAAGVRRVDDDAAANEILLDETLSRFRNSVERLDKKSAAISAAKKRLDQKIIELLSRPGRQTARRSSTTEVFEAIGRLAAEVGRSPNARALRPLFGLDARWRELANDHTAELQLADAFATDRVFMELNGVSSADGPYAYTKTDRAWAEGSVLSELIKVALDELIEQRSSKAAGAVRTVSAVALQDLLADPGRFEIERFRDLLFAMSATKSAPRSQSPSTRLEAGSAFGVDRAYALMRAVTSPHWLRDESGSHPSPRTIVQIVNLVLAQRSAEAIDVAARRLRSSRKILRSASLPTPPSLTREKAQLWVLALLAPLDPQFEETELFPLLFVNDQQQNRKTAKETTDDRHQHPEESTAPAGGV